MIISYHTFEIRQILVLMTATWEKKCEKLHRKREILLDGWKKNEEKLKKDC